MLRHAALALVLLSSTVGLAASSPLHDGRERAAVVEMKDALASTDFPLFDAGERVDGLPLVAVLRRRDTADYVSFVYGDCATSDDLGCAPPVEVQVWPACRRNLHLYNISLPGTPVPERTTVRGVPAAFLEDGLRLELQVSRSTVVVFAGSRSRVLRVAGALRRSGEPAPGGPLPTPATGALEGTLGC